MKKFVAVCLLVLAVLAFVPAAFAAPAHVFTVHHIGSMTHPYQKGAEHFKELLEKYSDGKMTLDIFGSNQLAAGAKAVEGTQLGTIDIFIENPMSVSNVIPSFEALNMPYLFNSAAQAFAMMDSEQCKVFAQDSEAHGIKLLGYWYNGWRNVSNSKRPIKKVEDLEGLTIRIAESQVFADMMAAFGMNAVPLANSEVFTALQMGTVDAQENPQNNYINNKYYEVNRYFSMTRHVFSVEPVGMNLELWNSLTAEEQETLQRAFNDATVYAREIAESTETNQLKEFLDKGADIEVSYIEDLTPFMEKVAPVYEKYKNNELGVYVKALEAAKAEVSK
ncbi:MAG: TRAP transporter substrate-binding protein [Synergistaceae bacterium]|nr:TRAP transporter substrate-binding protein [Synergistaceae bacterium]MBR1419336.1 TRAP transporter substrate-binding protein [Synergistaceae bacterium]